MLKHTFCSRTILLVACAVLMISCIPVRPDTEASDFAVISSSTPLPVIDVGNVLPTMTEAVASTAIPSPTPVLWTTQPITVDNLNTLKLVNQWGRGTAIKIEQLQSKQGQYLVLTPLGLYWYSSTALLTFVPDVDDFILSPDEMMLAVSLKTGDVQIWDAESMSVEQTIAHVFPEHLIQQIENHELLPYYVGGMAFSADGSQVAIGYADGKVEIYRVGEADSYATVQHDALSLWQTDVGLLYQLSFSPDGKTLAAFKFARYSNVNSNRITFWSLPDAKLISVSDAARYYRFPENAYLPDGNTLLAFSRKDSYLNLDLWDATTGKLINKFATGLSEIDSLDIAEATNEVTLLGSDTQGVYYRQVRQLPDGKLTVNEKLDQIPEDPELVAFRGFLLEQDHYNNAWGDDQIPELAAITRTENMPMQIKLEEHILNVPDANLQSPALQDNVAGAYYDPQGNFIAWCEPGRLNIRDEDGTTTSIELLLNSACDGLTVSSSKTHAAIWYGSSLYMVNLSDGTHNKASFSQEWAGNVVLTARFSVDEQLLFSSKDAIVSVWQVEPFQRLGDTQREERYVGRNVDLAMSKDKTVAVSLSVGDGTTADRLSQLMVWRLPDAFLLYRINLPFIGSIQPMFTAFALSTDGALIASGDDFGGIRFWSTETGEELFLYEVDARPLDMEFTPDDSGLLVVLADGTILLLGVE